MATAQKETSKQVKLVSRVLTNKGTILFTTEDGKNLSLNRDMIAVLKEMGDPIPNVGSIVKVQPSIDQLGNESDRWVQLA